jgi:ribosomal 30S subunit maturation factor RimM
MINIEKSLKKINKRIKHIKSLKTYKEKIVSNFRDIDYSDLVSELKNLNVIKTKLLNNDLERLIKNKWLYEDIIVYEL